MPEVRVPKQCLAFFRQEMDWLNSSTRDFRVPGFFQKVVVLVRILLGSKRSVYIFGKENRPLMRSRVIQERPRALVNVFQRDPDTAHKIRRTRTEMDQVRMNVLLRTDREIQGLEWECPPAVNFAEQLHDGWMSRDSTDAVAHRITIENAQVRARARIVNLSPLEMRLKGFQKIIRQAIEIRLGKVEDGETVALEIRSDRGSIEGNQVPKGRRNFFPLLLILTK